MARIRTIKPEFFTSEDIVELDPLTRLLYISLWCEADKEGRFIWKPKTFKMRYFPADSCDIEQMCDALVTRGLVSLYGDGLAYIPSFKDHQHINPRESESKLPAPNDKSATRNPRVNDATVTDREEGKGKESKQHASPIGFAEFWNAYPNKIGKGAAEKAFAKVTAELSVLLTAISQQSASEQWRKDSGKFIPHPATWLNQRRWEDGVAQVPAFDPEEIITLPDGRKMTRAQQQFALRMMQ